MNVINEKNQEVDEMWKQWEKDSKRGKIIGGIFIVAIGSALSCERNGGIHT
jgi:hypothetical protein